MVKVTVVNNVSRNQVIVDENSSIKDTLTEAGVNYATGITYLDGAPLMAGEINKTFSEFGVVDECMISCIVKADNA